MEHGHDGACARLDAGRVRRELATRHLCQPPATLVYLPATPSTNTHARTLAGEGAPHGTVVITDAQTAGRGRLGRTWRVPPCTGLTLSMILRPPPEDSTRPALLPS